MIEKKSIDKIFKMIGYSNIMLDKSIWEWMETTVPPTFLFILYIIYMCNYKLFINLKYI